MSAESPPKARNLLTGLRTNPRTACVGLVGVLLVLGFVASMITILLCFAIWPGEMKLTAGLFCPDDHPDAFVVTDTYSSAPGETSTTFTMYCMGPRGEVKDVGIFRQFLVLTLGHAVLVVLVIAVASQRYRRRRARRQLTRAGQSGPAEEPARR